MTLEYIKMSQEQIVKKYSPMMNLLIVVIKGS